MILRNELNLSTEFIAASGEIERAIVKIWEDVFEVEQLGINDEFFELGGDSLLATILCEELKHSLNIDIKPSELLNANTPLKISLITDCQKPLSDLPNNVVCINPAAKGIPLFIVHGAAGITFLWQDFIDEIGENHPLYVFQIPGYDGLDEPQSELEKIAECYLQSMLAIKPKGPWQIVSFCAGGWIVTEIIHQMQKIGLQPDRAILIDANIPPALAKDYKISRGFSVPIRLTLISKALMHTRLAISKVWRRIRLLTKLAIFYVRSTKEGGSLSNIERYYLHKARRLNEQNRTRSLQRAKSINYPIADDRDINSDDKLEQFDIYLTETAFLARAHLLRAFSKYVPNVIEFPVEFILNKSRLDEYSDPKHPLKCLLPNHRVHILGRNHQEALHSKESARLLRSLLEGIEAPIKSHLPRCRGDLMTDNSIQ